MSEHVHQLSAPLTRQIVSLNDTPHRTKRSKLAENQGEATFLEAPMFESNQFSPDELDGNTEHVRPMAKATTPMQTRRRSSKIPIRASSLPPSKKGALHLVAPDDEERRDQRKRLASSDDEDQDLKQRLQEEKRQRKKTEELLIKEHENYEELLGKYEESLERNAQSENTIDQLRFQPKITGDNTPKSSVTEHVIHFTQQSKANITALRSSGAYDSPASSIRPVQSSTTTTARKSASSTNSSSLDETSPEIVKVDLLFDTRSLGAKMKSFLVLMDENQLNLGEQKQVYEQIREDYETLMKEFEQNKHHLDPDTDLHQELETMKQLLKDIVKQITQNLLGKSAIESSTERSTNDNSQLSVRSSLCNHDELMDQYQKLLNAVNTTHPTPIKSIINELTPKSEPSSQQSIKSKQKAYVYVSGDSDDDGEQQESEDVTPIPYTKGVESTSLGLDYIPSILVKHHRHPIEEERYENLQSKRKHLLAPEITSRTNDYDSGIGTNNLTKLSFDSKLYTSTMDESHFQSLDDEQESISSSSRSSDSASGSPSSKKLDEQSIYRRKPSGYSNSYQSHPDISIKDLPSESYKKKNMHRSFHTWKPQKTSVSHRSRLTPVHRGVSITAPSIEDYKMRALRSLPSPEISSKIKNNQDLRSQSRPPSSYKSSLYINHTNNKSQEKLDRSLYLDPQTGIVYRYETEKDFSPPRICYEPPPSTKLYRCLECGSVNTSHHRHHINRVKTNTDDLGYESGHQRRYRYVDYVSSSSSSDDSDSDITSPTYLEMLALNRAYNRAENIRYQSRCLSRHIVRQLKLTLASL